MSKIKTREEIKEIVSDLKKQGKKIVTTNGSFDIFHYGHVSYLKEAKKQGDILIVGVNTDRSVKEWKKHIGYKDWEKRPINPVEARAAVLAALSCVDYVTIYDEPSSIEFVKSIIPDIHVNGGEYGVECIEAKVVKENGGKIHIIDKINGFSSSEIMKKIRDSSA